MAAVKSRFADASLEQFIYTFIAKRAFGNQNDVGLSGDCRPKRQMARMPSHDFDNLHPTVRAGGRARSFDYFRDVAQGGIEPERVVRALKVLVDCFWDGYKRHAFLRQLCGHSQGIFTAANDNRIETESFDILDYFRGSILTSAVGGRLLEGICPGRAEICAPIAIPAPHSFAVQWQRVRQRTHQASPPVE